MRQGILKFIRYSVTILALLLAGFLSYHMLRNYLIHPWTRDAQVHAHIVQLTSRVSGPIVKLPIKDNQAVKKDQLLWRIDPSTFKSNVAKTEAALKSAEYKAKEATDLAKRARALYNLDKGALAEYKLVELENRKHQFDADVKEEKAKLQHAKLQLSFIEMRAPSDGYITNLRVHIGSHLKANQPVLAFIDTKSFWVQAFFKETLMRNVKKSDLVIIRLMTYPDQPLEGTIVSIGWGIAMQDGSTGVDLLPSINPSFDWIRLAQRIPVKIHFKKIPVGIKLRVGMTATVIVMHKAKKQ